MADRTLRFWHLDWEPEERALPPWDEKARPFLESFVSLRLKPETVRTTAPWTDGEVEALVEQMRHRGFGGLQKDAVLGRLRDLAQQDDRAAVVLGRGPGGGSAHRPGQRRPRGTRRAEEDPLEQGRDRRCFRLWRRAVAAATWYRPAVKPRLVAHHADFLRAHLDAYDLTARTRPRCDPAANREDLLAKVLAPEVSAIDLSCVARLEDGIAGRALPRPRGAGGRGRRLRQQRHLRGAVALLVGLGDPAIDGLCDALGHDRPEARALAARALAESSSPRARTCLGAGALHPRAEVRAAVAVALPIALARGQVEPGPGWEMTNRLVDDPDPAVRQGAADLLYLFNAEAARPAAERLQKDTDPAVAEAATARLRRGGDGLQAGTAVRETLRPRPGVDAGGCLPAAAYWTLNSISSTGSVPVAPALFVKTYWAVVSA